MVGKYYDHEDLYQHVKEKGGKSLDDLSSAPEPKPPYHELHEFIRSPYCPKQGNAIDLGCGTGDASFILADNGFQVLGIEYSDTAVRMAQENLGDYIGRVRFERGDILNLDSVPASHFDVVIDHHVSHCILPDDREKFFSKVRDLLLPGGIYYGTVMAAQEPFEPQNDILAPPDGVRWGQQIDPESRIGNDGHRYYVQEKELQDELSEQGLEILMIKKDSFERIYCIMDLTVFAKKRE